MEIKMIPREKIVPDPDQPREHFDKESIQELGDSIKEFGLLQPIIVKPGRNDTYEIIAGERRWRASKFAGLKELPAIVKDVSKQEQEVQSLIENVHREDLTTMEKGKKVYQIFQLHGIDMGSKELANKVRMLSEKSALSADEKLLLDICNKINVKPRVIRDWLESISISPEIQKIEVEKSKEERIAGRTLARLSTIEDEDLQKKVYAKIIEQDMGERTASRFITQIKQAKEEVQETLLAPGIMPIVEEEPEMPVHIEIPEEEAKTLKEAIEKERKEREEYLKTPEGREQARLVNSWLAHCRLNFKDLTCPVCGNDYTSLVWSCHGVNVKEARDMLHDKLDKSKKRG